MPLGAFISSNEIMSTLTFDPILGHLTTSGGHPVSCAAALASLQIISKKEILDSVVFKGDLFRKLLKHSSIKSLRGKGLLLAIEFENETLNQKIIQLCFEKGLLTDWFLFSPFCLRIAPPLIISEEEVKMACSIILDVLEDTKAMS